MKTLLLTTVMILLMPASIILAQNTGGVSAQCRQCLNDSGGVVPTMIDCIQTEYEQQDARLNAAYKKVMGQIASEQAQKLRLAQRAWIQFRDTYSDYLYDPNGGTDARVEALYWMAQCTAEQAERLEQLSRR